MSIFQLAPFIAILGVILWCTGIVLMVVDYENVKNSQNQPWKIPTQPGHIGECVKNGQYYYIYDGEKWLVLNVPKNWNWGK